MREPATAAITIRMIIVRGSRDYPELHRPVAQPGTALLSTITWGWAPIEHAHSKHFVTNLSARALSNWQLNMLLAGRTWLQFVCRTRAKQTSINISPFSHLPPIAAAAALTLSQSCWAKLLPSNHSKGAGWRAGWLTVGLSGSTWNCIKSPLKKISIKVVPPSPTIFSLPLAWPTQQLILAHVLVLGQ